MMPVRNRIYLHLIYTDTRCRRKKISSSNSINSMITRLYRNFTRFDVKTHLLLGFGFMVILTLSVGWVGWWGVSNIQRAFNIIQQQSLPAIAQSMALAEHSASLVAQAPFVANAKILFHLDEESARLREKLNAFSQLVQELGFNEVNKVSPKSHLANLANLATRIEATLIELIEITREGIFLTGKMHDRRYELASTYQALESRIVEQTHQSAEGTGGQTDPDANGVRFGGGPEHGIFVANIDEQLFLLSGILGEAHRIAGALTAAMTAENTESLQTLETRYEWGSLLLQSKLDQLTNAELVSDIKKAANAFLRLGAGEGSVFELRREQFHHEDRRAYLLTVSNILSAELNDQVTEIVERVKAAAEVHSADAAAVLKDSKARILILGVICLAAAIFSAFYVVRDLGGNLSAVTRSIMQLASGDRDIEVPAITRADEIGSLARAFNMFKETMFKLDDTSRQLAETNRLLEAIFHNMNDGLAVFDAGDRLVAWNRRFLELYGLPQAQVHAGLSLKIMDEILAKEEVTVRSLDGRLIPRNEFNLGRRLKSQQVEEYMPDGRILESRSNPMPDGGFVTIYTDLTERKAIEAQLRQAQKMEGVGQLTGGLAHDFNNLLATIIGHLSLLQEELAGQDRLRKKALRALEAADRGTMITQRLLAFSRNQALQPQQVNVNELIEGMLDLLSYSVGEPIEVKLQLQEDVWPVVIDPGQLENVLMNLALNSRDAIPEGGQLFIQTENCAVDEVAAGRYQEIETGNYVVLSVKDTGTGMSAEVLNHAFEPFFTTKEVGAGSGLGLSMVYGFITQSGGHIRIDSAIGQGTTIRLYLPKGMTGITKPIKRQQRPESAEFDPHGKTVMVVEDDANVRQTAVAMLTSLGYRTVQAADGQEALRLLDEMENISLLFSDVVLPGNINGPDVVREARKRHPDIKILYCSGFTRHALIEEGYLKGDVDLIEKPYKKDILAQKLLAVFGR